MSREDEWLTTPQAAQRVGLSAYRLRQLVEQGDGPRAYRIGSHLRFRESDVARWMESRRVDPEAQAS